MLQTLTPECPTSSSPTIVRLVCLPYAGGGPSVFRTWPSRLVPHVEPVAVALAGRGARLLEKPPTRVRELAVTLASSPELAAAERVAFFGHSLGALVAFELIRERRRRGAAPALHLFVSSRRAPRFPEPPNHIHRLPDAAFVGEVQRRYDAIPAEVLREPELMQLLLPSLRADFEMLETYEYVEEPPLECPITVIGGTDDPHAPLPSLEAWREETSGPFALQRFEGGHFYFRRHEAELLQLVRQALEDGASATAEPR